MEHNAVMRPLQQLGGVEFDRIPCDSEGFLQHGALEGLFRPNTRLVVLAHASNVCGSVQDAAAVGAACARHGCFFLLDGAQTAGHYPIDFAALRLSALAVPGHKGLLGPSGIGALLLTDELAANLTPLVAGGTGSASDSELLPPYLPDRLESGTPNLPGIYGLRAALAFVEQQGVERLRRHELALTGRFLEGLRDIPKLRAVGRDGVEGRAAVVSVACEGMDPAFLADALGREYGVLTRVGLHCAPNAHKVLGTYPTGTVRFSFGPQNTEAHVDAALKALGELSRRDAWN